MKCFVRWMVWVGSVAMLGCAQESGVELDSEVPTLTLTDSLQWRHVPLPSTAAPATPAPTPAPGMTPVPIDCSAFGSIPQDFMTVFEHQGYIRAAYVHMPDNYVPTAQTPLVMDFHGFMSPAFIQMFISGIRGEADARGMIAVNTIGTLNSDFLPQWSSGPGPHEQNNVDDVGYVSKLLDILQSVACVDTSRIFAAGFSNGGAMSHRLGCELEGRIAGFASVSGPYAIEGCTQERPVPLMHFHGTTDPIIPYDGDPTYNWPAVPDLAKTRALLNACTVGPTQTYLTGDVRCETWSGCSANADVTLCTVTGGGHAWPGGPTFPGTGYTSTDINATQAMLDFFLAHPW